MTWWLGARHGLHRPGRPAPKIAAGGPVGLVAVAAREREQLGVGGEAEAAGGATGTPRSVAEPLPGATAHAVPAMRDHRGRRTRRDHGPASAQQPPAHRDVGVRRRPAAARGWSALTIRSWKSCGLMLIGAIPPRSSAVWSRSRAREVWLFTVPSEIRRSRAVSATDRPSQCRSTTVRRCISGQLLQRRHQVARGRRGRRPGAAGWSNPSRPGRSRRHGRRVLVDRGAQDGLADVGVLRGRPAHPRPRDVQPGQRGLHDVLGGVPVAAQGVGHPSQLRPARLRVVHELRASVPSGHARPRSVVGPRPVKGSREGRSLRGSVVIVPRKPRRKP